MGLYLLLPFLIICATLSSCASKLLYFPDKLEPEKLAEATSMLHAKAFPSADPRHFAAFVVPAHAPCRGLVILFHGNAGQAWHRKAYADVLARRGWSIALMEYPGYGCRPGDPDEKTIVSDAIVQVQALRQAYPQGQLIIAGESLGAGVAAEVAATGTIQPDALLLITPWDTLYAVAHGKFPWLPISLLLWEEYDSVTHVQSLQRPLALIIAAQDTVIPPVHAERLFAQAPAPKRSWIIPGAGHNDWMRQAPPALWDEVLNFLCPVK